MSIQDEIEKGIGAHGLWKQRLIDAIETGKSDFTPETVSMDNQCVFGKWLYGCDHCKSSPYYEDVRELHAKFHQQAGTVLQHALAVQKTQAEELISIGSEYRKISSALTLKLIEWKDS